MSEVAVVAIVLPGRSEAAPDFPLLGKTPGLALAKVGGSGKIP
jgi:hypothetical protein